MVWRWLSLVFLHQCAHLSKEFQKTNYCRLRFQNVFHGFTPTWERWLQQIPTHIFRTDESRSICLVLMISAWLKPNQAYMTSCCQGHGSSHRLVTWPCLWSFGSHSVLEIKWLKNQPSIVLPIGSMENMYIYQPLVDLFMVNVCKCRCIYNNIYTSPMDPMGIFQSSTIWLSSFRASLANMWSLDFHQFRVSENVPNKKRKEIDWTSIVFLVSSVCVCVSVFFNPYYRKRLGDIQSIQYILYLCILQCMHIYISYHNL